MKSGIYKIVNILNNKIYIGSTNNLKTRKNNHFSNLKLNKHSNPYLQRSYNKYGKENFKFRIIEECVPKLLIEREQYYIDTLIPDYNIRKYAISNLGLIHSVSAKEKIGNANRNKIISKETKEKMSKSRIGYKHSKKTKEKMKFAKMGRIVTESELNKKRKPITQLDKSGKFIQNFNSISQASDLLKIHISSICSCCKHEKLQNNKLKTAGGFRWMYNE